MGGICFDSEDQFWKYVENDHNDPVSSSKRNTQETSMSSSFINLLWQEKYYNCSNNSIDYLKIKNSKTGIQDVLDFFRLTYFKLYFNNGEKIEEFSSYNSNYRKKHFKNWKNRMILITMRSDLFNSSKYKRYKEEKDDRLMCYESFKLSERPYKNISDAKEILYNIQNFSTYNCQNPVIKLLIFASYYIKKSDIWESDSDYSFVNEFSAVNYVRDIPLDSKNSFKILHDLLQTKKSLRKDYDISYLMRLAEIEHYLFIDNSSFQPIVAEKADLIEINNNLYNILYDLHKETLQIRTDYANCEIHNIHRVSDNEKCIRTYLNINNKLTLKLDSSLEFTPLNFSSSLLDLRDDMHEEKYLKLVKEKSYQNLISIGIHLCKKYNGKLPDKISEINSLDS